MANLSEIIISSTPLNNDKLHAADGALLGATYTYNYDTVGTVNNSGGVVSGFSTNNYIELPDGFIANNNPFDIIIKFTTGDDVATSQNICFLYRTTYPVVMFEIYNGKCYAVTNTTSYQSTYNTPINIVANTTYKVKLSFDGSDKYTFYNNVNNNWTEIASMTNGALDTRPFTCRFGCGNDSSQQDQTIGTLPFLGLIDLNETSISINNQTWWQYEATSSNPYTDFISYIADLYNDDPNAEYFAKAVPASYEVVGSLVDNNGVVSGFSDNTNYIELPSTFTPSNKNWEIILKLTTPATISGQQTMFTFMDSTKSANVTLSMDSNSLSFNMFNIGYLTLVNPLSTSTSYKVKIAYDGSTYKGYIENSGNWSLVDTINDGTALPSVYSGFLGVRSYGSYRTDAFQGSIDLKETSISLDNTTWWEYVPEINDPEQAWQYEYNKYGVCGKFVYGGTNNTVRLPKYGNKLYTTDNTASNVYYYIQVK